MTDFEIVWADYPRKTNKAYARKCWNKLSPDAETVQLMLDALVWQKASAQWQRGIIPHLSTWLNQARWEDERPSGGNGSSAPTPAERAHVRAVHQRMVEASQQHLSDVAAEYRRTHPLWKPS